LSQLNLSRRFSPVKLIKLNLKPIKMSNRNFKVGDKVLCIDDYFDPSIEGYYLIINRPKLMEIYTVRCLYDISIRVEEIHNPSDNFYYETYFQKRRFIKVPKNFLNTKAKSNQKTMLKTEKTYSL